MQDKIKIKNETDMINYCLQMNCLGCNFNTGNYKDCPHLHNKIKAREQRTK